MFLCGRDFIRTLAALMPTAEQTISLATFKAELSHGAAAPELLALWEEIIRKARAGVRVKALIHYGDRRASCPKTNYLVMKKLREAGAQVRFVGPGGCQHMKLMIIDNALGFLGSHNLSVASSAKNHEISRVIKDQAEVAELTNLFDAFFDNASVFRGQQL